MTRPRLGLLFGIICSALLGCHRGRTVVLYTSVDQPYAEPVLAEFEARTGIRVAPVFDVEASKTTGLVQRLAAERAHPQADVFWSSEIAQTLWLRGQGALAAYRSPAARDIPAAWRDPQGYWTAFGLRGRVFLVDTRQVGRGEEPQRLDDLLTSTLDPRKLGLANPLFGTSATQAAVLYATRGATAARAYYAGLHRRGVRVLDGNSVVRDRVVAGDLKVGLTDTDDAAAAVSRGASVRIVFPDQSQSETLFIPNTVALVAGAPHESAGRALLDHLLSHETEQRLIRAGFLYASVRKAPPGALRVDWESVARQVAIARDDLREIFARP